MDNQEKVRGQNRQQTQITKDKPETATQDSKADAADNQELAKSFYTGMNKPIKDTNCIAGRR